MAQEPVTLRISGSRDDLKRVAELLKLIPDISTEWVRKEDPPQVVHVTYTLPPVPASADFPAKLQDASQFRERWITHYEAIHDLELSKLFAGGGQLRTRLRTILTKQRDLDTLYDLLLQEPEQVLTFRHFGFGCLAEIDGVLIEHGFKPLSTFWEAAYPDQWLAGGGKTGYEYWKSRHSK